MGIETILWIVYALIIIYILFFMDVEKIRSLNILKKIEERIDKEDEEAIIVME